MYIDIFSYPYLFLFNHNLIMSNRYHVSVDKGSEPLYGSDICR